MMRISLLAGAAALLALAVPETAAAQAGYGYAPQDTACERQRSDDKLAGGVAGALIGGLIGGAIGTVIALKIVMTALPQLVAVLA